MNPLAVLPGASPAAPVVAGPLALLAAGIPLTLLIDLLDPDGPDSRAIYRREVADLSWLRAA